MIGEAIDKLIGVFSPKSQLDRVLARENINLREAKYAAAKTTLQSGGWTTQGDTKINTLVQNSSGILRARARQLVRDMPAMATAIDRLVDHQVGKGSTLQCRIKGADGNLNTILNQQIEDAWKYWCDEADETGRLHFDEIQQLACRQEYEIGEYIFIKKRTRMNGRYLPFSLMVLESDQLTSQARPLTGNDIIEGVEYEKRTGRAVAYHFDDPDRWNKTLRIPAEQVIIGYKTLRPGQLRGVTPLAPVLLLSHSLRDYLDAEVSTAQRAARWLAFVTSPNPQETMAAFGAATSSVYTDSNDQAKYTMEMGNAVVDFLKTGEDVTIANHNRPGDAFTPFVRHLLQTFAATVGCTYELVSGDYELKYTGARVARNDMNKALGVRRARLIRQLCENVRREFMDWAVLTGKVDIPDYFRNPAPYMNAVWMHDGQDAIDPLREGRAEADAILNKTRSPQEILIARGRDPEQVLDEFKEWNQMLKDRGLYEEPTDTGLQTNPAAVGAPEGGGQKQEKIAHLRRKEK